MVATEYFYLAAAALAGFAALWFALPYAIRRLEVGKCARICRENRLLVLSFDDGPGPDLTPRVLDLLRDLEIKASFFSSATGQHNTRILSAGRPQRVMTWAAIRPNISTPGRRRPSLTAVT